MSDHERDLDAGTPWDDATWVDVDDHGHWQPSALERTRAFLLLGVLLGFLGLAALVALIVTDDDEDGDEPVAVDDTEASTTTEATTTTSAPPTAESVDGAAPPEGCEDDDREARPLRERSATPVIVLNGTGIGGLAGDTVDQLEDLGYTASPANGPRTDPTVITYLEGFCAEAAQLAEDLSAPDATLEAAGSALSDSTGAARVQALLGLDDFSG